MFFQMKLKNYKKVQVSTYMRKILYFWKRNVLINGFNFSLRKMAYPYEYFKSIGDYQTPVNKKEDFFSKSKKSYPDSEEIERENFFNYSKSRTAKKQPNPSLESDFILLISVFRNY